MGSLYSLAFLVSTFLMQPSLHANVFTQEVEWSCWVADESKNAVSGFQIYRSGNDYELHFSERMIPTATASVEQKIKVIIHKNEETKILTAKFDTPSLKGSLDVQLFERDKIVRNVASSASGSFDEEPVYLLGNLMVKSSPENSPNNIPNNIIEKKVKCWVRSFMPEISGELETSPRVGSQSEI